MITQQEVVNKFEEVKALLHKGWIRGEFAITKQGDKCSVTSPDAASFCLLGAIIRVTDKDNSMYCKLHEHIIACVVRNNFSGIPSFNDNSTKEEVLAGIDYTIKEIQEGRDFLD